MWHVQRPYERVVSLPHNNNKSRGSEGEIEGRFVCPGFVRGTVLAMGPCLASSWVYEMFLGKSTAGAGFEVALKTCGNCLLWEKPRRKSIPRV